MMVMVLLLSPFAAHLSPLSAHNDTEAAKPKKDSIYNSTQIKLDILSPVLTSGLNNWQLQHYEMAVNVQLARRFFPTLELGYGGGKTSRADTISYSGQGGFMRVGCDINPLKRNPNSPHAMLVGLRVGTAAQQWSHPSHGTGGVRADCWGEVVAGCQVEIAKVNKTAFYMGWMGRIKFLFTRKDAPLYIPGYGTNDNISWGANYYLGWRF